jgi:hypothetical protein
MSPDRIVHEHLLKLGRFVQHLRQAPARVSLFQRLAKIVAAKVAIRRQRVDLIARLGDRLANRATPVKFGAIGAFSLLLCQAFSLGLCARLDSLTRLPGRCAAFATGLSLVLVAVA